MTLPRFVPTIPAILRPIVTVTMGLLLCACSTVDYYAHVAKGQSELVMNRRDVSEVLRDPSTDAQIRKRLELAQQARQFATARLDLPDNRSYTSYVKLNRSYVVWNVFATPRFSISPIQHCFPFAGCVAYRGYFSRDKAKAESQRLEAQGDDVYVGGVPAYSTLGWFDDPILSSMMRWDDDELAGTIFHELAHQLIYVKDDSSFNESFASFVQEEGLRQWRQSRGLPAQNVREQTMDDGFTWLVMDLRDRLKTLYASGVDEQTMAAAKQQTIDDFRVRYAQWRDLDWPGDHRYDAWVNGPINNARLLPFGIYDRWTPVFLALFRHSEGQWPAFYASVREFARQPYQQRQRSLQQWLDSTGHPSVAPSP